MADASSRLTTTGGCSCAGQLRCWAGLRSRVSLALLIAFGVSGVRSSAAADKADKAEDAAKVQKADKADKADKAEKTERADKADKTEKSEKAEGGAKPPGVTSAAGTSVEEKGAAGAKGAGGAAVEDGTPSKRRGPALLRSGSPKHSPAPAPAPVKPGEDPPPPSPLTMDALRQDMKRGRDSGGISPDAPARTKVEQVLAEMVKTRAALRDDTSRLENLTVDGLSAGEAGAPGGGPAVPGAPGQPPQKNPLDVLAKALRGIKPDQAAPIVARIDRRLAATVLLKMPPVDAGKIMGALKPDVAAEIATEIAMRARPQHPLLGMGAKR